MLIDIWVWSTCSNTASGSLYDRSFWNGAHAVELESSYSPEMPSVILVSSSTSVYRDSHCLRPMYPSNDGYRLSLSSIVLMVRAARSIGLWVCGAGMACCCGCCGCCGCDGGCDMEDCRWKLGLFGAGVFMNAPGPERCGVAGGIWYAMAG
jgi:hypothetical protein